LTVFFFFFFVNKKTGGDDLVGCLREDVREERESCYQFGKNKRRRLFFFHLDHKKKYRRAVPIASPYM
jgi:hypothetical protein